MDLPLRKRRSKRVRMAAIPKRNRTGGMYRYFFMINFIIIYQYLLRSVYLIGIFCAKSEKVTLNLNNDLKILNYLSIENSNKC